MDAHPRLPFDAPIAAPLFSFRLSRPSRLGFRALDDTILEMRILKLLKENKESEPVSNYEDLVRIIFVWCEW